MSRGGNRGVNEEIMKFLNAKDYRKISLLSHILNVLTCILTRSLQNKVMRNKLASTGKVEKEGTRQEF